jgi:ascorbate-specific PTS system EIIC-type component UlaA
MGNFAGVLANFLGGWTLAITHSFIPAFTLVVAAMLLSVFAYWFLISPGDPVNWEKPDAPQKKLAYMCHSD